MLVGFNPNLATQNYPQNYRKNNNLAFKGIEEVLNPVVKEIIALAEESKLDSSKDIMNIVPKANEMVKEKSLNPQDIQALKEIFYKAKKGELPNPNNNGFWEDFMKDVLIKLDQKI